jgi:hypothetical protein
VSVLWLATPVKIAARRPIGAPVGRTLRPEPPEDAGVPPIAISLRVP